MDIEQATEEEYRRSFDCIKSHWMYLQISEHGVNPINARKKRSVPPVKEEKEGPFSQYNGLQRRISLAVSRKRMPYVKPKPDRPEDSKEMRWDRFKVLVRPYYSIIFFA